MKLFQKVKEGREINEDLRTLLQLTSGIGGGVVKLFV